MNRLQTVQPAHNVQQTSEDKLITVAKQGDEAALSELFSRHYTSSLRLAWTMLRSQEDAEDAVQAAYFLAFRNIANFRGEASFKTWITRIVVNCCLLQIRGPWRRVSWAQIEDSDGKSTLELLRSTTPDPETSAWFSELNSAHAQAVARLPKNLRDAYALHVVSGLALTDVAEVLGLTLAATKTRVFRARAMVRTRLASTRPDAWRAAA